MWKKLRERYAVSNISTQVQLQMNLNRLCCSDKIMLDFVDQYEEIFNRLEGMGSAFPETMQVAILLSSLSEKSKSPYGAIVAAIQTAAKTLTWESVTARLLQEYDEKQWNNSSDGSKSLMQGHAMSSFAQNDRRVAPDSVRS